MKPKRLFNVKLTDREYRKLEENSEKCELTKSAYIRQLINGYKPREAPGMDYHKMIGELKAIGNNLNQLAYIANALGVVDAEQYHVNAERLRAAVREIEEKMFPAQ